MAAMAGSGAIVRQGHLRKLKTMRKKYFVLRAESGEASARLEYYESEKKFRAGAAPRRVLPLRSCYNITRRLDLKQKHVIALFTRDEQLCVVAENEQELHAWLAAILKQHRSDDASKELMHPIQHVWQVNVQKKGLGASKNIQGLYNLCLTDKTLTLVKIKSHNNIISDLGIPERVEYSLKNIRRCGDSECFFYMEVGRLTVTGAGELWMHSDDSNIAQSMHSTIYHAMQNCAKETENEKDHIVIPGKGSLGRDRAHPLPARRQTYSDGSGRAGLYSDKGLCMGSCIRQCVCSSAAYSVDDAALPSPRAPFNAENQPANNTLTSTSEKGDIAARAYRHHRTESLPAGAGTGAGAGAWAEAGAGAGAGSDVPALRIAHARTFSAPLTGDEVERADRALLGRPTHSSCKAVNGTDVFAAKKAQWAGRRASAGARLSKLAMSPAHTKNAGTLRNRCDSMPSRACTTFESERPPPRHTDLLEGLDSSRDDIDSVEWYGTPRIPEEPDSCDIMSKDFMNLMTRGGSVAHSRTSSFGADDTGEGVGLGATEGLDVTPDGYLPMAPLHDPTSGRVSSSGSVYSGTPSTDPRFSGYQLEPAVSHIAEERATRAYSVGSRPGPRAEPARTRAYSAGARHRPSPSGASATASAATTSPAPVHYASDHMELDFSVNSASPKSSIACVSSDTRARNVDEYVDMSPRAAGYVDMRPGDPPAVTAHSHPPATPDGYVHMSYARAPTRPIAIAQRTPQSHRPPPTSPHTPQVPRPVAPASPRTPRTPLGSQTIFPISLESPASPPATPPGSPPELDELAHHALSTVREISEEGRRSPDRTPIPVVPPVSCSPQYVTLMRPMDPAAATPAQELDSPVANKTVAWPSDADDNRAEAGGALHYAALDLEPRRPAAVPAQRLYTQIDFLRSEQMHADAT